MHVQNLMNSLWDIRIFLGLVPKESPCTFATAACFTEPNNFICIYRPLLATRFWWTHCCHPSGMSCNVGWCFFTDVSAQNQSYPWGSISPAAYSWIVWHSQKGKKYPATSVTIYQPMPCDNPEERRRQLHNPEISQNTD